MRRTPIVTVLEIGSETPETPETEARLEALLPEGTRRRLSLFTHRARRRQSLWGRLLALAESRSLGAELIEEPPYPPYLLKDEGQLALSIAHTGRFVALGTASFADQVMGLDLETVRPMRRLEDVCRLSLGAAAELTVAACRRSGSYDPFFLAWGMMEAQVKLNRGGARYRLIAEGERPAVVGDDGTPLLVTYEAPDVLDALRLTVLTSTLKPVVRRLTSDDLTAQLLQH